jgi:uncharacterized coiled-coil DUF342 family protein
MINQHIKKGVFQLRDDIKKLFESLNSLYINKLNLYESLAINTEECNFHMVSGDFETIDEKLETSNATIAEIDVLDFEITQIKSEICRLSGIEYYRFENFFLINSTDEITDTTNDLLTKMKKLMRQSLDNRDSMIQKIHEKQAEMSSSIESLSRTRALNNRFMIMNY